MLHIMNNVFIERGRIWKAAGEGVGTMMERPRLHRGRLRHQEDVLAVHVAELKTDLSTCKDARVAAKLARWFLYVSYHD